MIKYFDEKQEYWLKFPYIARHIWWAKLFFHAKHGEVQRRSEMYLHKDNRSIMKRTPFFPTHSPKFWRNIYIKFSALKMQFILGKLQIQCKTTSVAVCDSFVYIQKSLFWELSQVSNTCVISSFNSKFSRTLGEKLTALVLSNSEQIYF